MKQGSLASLLLFFLMVCAPAVEGADLLTTVEKQIREDLLVSISPKTELEGIRIVRGGEFFGPAAKITLKSVYMNGYSGKNRVIYAVYLQDAAGRNPNAVVEATFDMNEEVYVTARPIARGEIISQDDYYIVRHKASKLPAGAITNRAEIENKTMKSTVSEGVILRNSYFAAASIVKKGQRINLFVETNSVAIAAQGVLKRDTSIGQPANVQCDLTKKEVSGILVSPTEVRVKL